MKHIAKVNPLIGFAIVLLIASSIAIYGVWAFRAHDRAEQLVAEDLEIINSIDQLQSGLLSMETGLRGYILTGSNEFLDHYYMGKSQYEAALSVLLRISDETESQYARWEEVQALETQWETHWAETAIQIRQEVNKGRASGEILVSPLVSESEEQVMEAIRRKISEGMQEQNLILRERLHGEQNATRRANNVIIWGIGLSVLLGLVSGSFLNWANVRKARQIELQQLLIEGRERERQQIARDLHDGPIQDLIVASMALQEISTGFDTQRLGQLDRVKKTLQAVVADLRTHALELRSPVLSKFGFVKAVQSHLETFQRQHPELLIRLEASPEDPPLPEACREILYRIYQEAMNNIARHAGASQVTIHFRSTGKQAVLEIADNGAGFKPADDLLSLARNGHLGLVGMRERAEAAGGSLEVDAKPGEGTRLRAVIPLMRGGD